MKTYLPLIWIGGGVLVAYLILTKALSGAKDAREARQGDLDTILDGM